MTFEERYELIIQNFASRRKEMLNLMTNVVPTATEMHRRSWRVQQLENAIYDIKTTLAACNLQLDKERDRLDNLSSENERLQAQERKLTEDIKLLEGVTGMQAIIPCDAQTGLMGEINDMADEFRNNFAQFYFNLPPLKQEIKADPTLEKDGHILIETLRDYVTLQFDHRAADSTLSKIAEERSIEADKIEKSLSDDVMRIEREIESQRKVIEDEAGKSKETLQEQTKVLRADGKKAISQLKKVQDDLKKRIQRFEDKKRRSTMRCQNLQSRNVAIKESFRRRAKEIELNLDRFENRIEAIKRAPNVADKNLINIALILTQKSEKMNAAIAEMRKEIADFNQWLRN